MLRRLVHRSWPVAVLVTAALAAPAHADLTDPETIFVDSFSTDNTRGGVTVPSSDVLTADRWYAVAVGGTFTAFGRSAWRNRDGCGDAERSPENPSPGQASVPAGQDAETAFAEPEATPCPALPKHYSGFLVDIGDGFKDIDPVDGRYTSPRADHIYRYLIQGRGQAVRFRIADSSSSDNNGILTVNLRPAVRSDCGANAACAEATPDTPAPQERPVTLPPAPASVLRGLPSTRVCLSRRRFPIHIGPSPRRNPLVSVAVTVDGRGVDRIRRVRKKRLRYFRAIVDLRGKPRGRYTVKIVTRSRNGRLGRAERRYRTCF